MAKCCSTAWTRTAPPWPRTAIRSPARASAAFALRRLRLAHGATEVPLVNLSAPVFAAITAEGPQDARPHVLAAVAAAWALGLPTDLIRAGLLHFGEPRHTSAVH